MKRSLPVPRRMSEEGNSHGKPILGDAFAMLGL